jgi:hypothetical protein
MDEKGFAGVSSADLAESLGILERVVARVRSSQMELIREADRAQVPLADGCRSLQEWVAGRVDVSTETANRLVATARTLEALPHLALALAEGEVTADRAEAVARLATADDELDALLACEALDIAGIRHRAALRRRVSRAEERRALHDRYLALQPNLDESRWRIHGDVAGFAGRVIDQALIQKGDEFPDLPDRPLTRGQRNADALWAMAQDALDGSGRVNGDGGGSGGPMVTVFVDAAEAAPTRGEAGVVIESGPRVGPDTLEMILCTGAVEITAVASDRTPLGIGTTSRAIPPRLRRFVLGRDGGCVADGCTSRYRLQAHHRTPHAQCGKHDPTNLVTLCWYHHHVVIHGHGYRIDPTSPPHRLRFLRPTTPRGPP